MNWVPLIKFEGYHLSGAKQVITLDVSTEPLERQTAFLPKILGKGGGGIFSDNVMMIRKIRLNNINSLNWNV